MPKNYIEQDSIHESEWSDDDEEIVNNAVVDVEEPNPRPNRNDVQNAEFSYEVIKIPYTIATIYDMGL